LRLLLVVVEAAPGDPPGLTQRHRRHHGRGEQEPPVAGTLGHGPRLSIEVLGCLSAGYTHWKNKSRIAE